MGFESVTGFIGLIYKQQNMATLHNSVTHSVHSHVFTTGCLVADSRLPKAYVPHPLDS
jgi:hypothetical protein